MTPNIESLLSQLTLEEKISLLSGADIWRTVAIPRLGIPALKTTDGPIGARGDDDPSSPTSAAFPCGAALAASWNPELVERVGRALGHEVKSKGAHLLLAPTVNLHRSPLGGRNFECYSEDPHLTAQMAVAYIRGLQSEGVGACIKHFVCNDSEFQRMTINSKVAERPLRELYLRPFELALLGAHPWAVMSSYNKVNGTSSSENPLLLREILKGEWGFDGLVISDWWGTYSERAIAAGLDLEMPGPACWMGDPALEMVKTGRVDLSVIDDKVRRLLRTLDRVGAFEHPALEPETAQDTPETRAVAREVATQAIVLLKNERNLLPMKDVRSIAVIGANAKWTAVRGGGSCRVTPHYVVSPLEGIKARAGSATVQYAIGYPIDPEPPLFDTRWLTKPFSLEYFDGVEMKGRPNLRSESFKAEMTWMGYSVQGRRPGSDSTDLGPVQTLELPEFAVRVAGEFRVPTTARYSWSVNAVGRCRMYLDGTLVAENWTEDEPSTGKPLTAETDLDSAKTHSLRLDYAPLALHWKRLRIGCLERVPEDPIAAAVELAAESDVAIVFAGLTEIWESEGFDRTNMDLPGKQNELIDRVSSANPNTIVVLNAGSPIAMPWLDRVPALVQAWYLGQETGNAIGDVLFGIANPSGKLPITFPKRLRDNPAYLNYPGENGSVLYGEGLFVGYRYYDAKDIEPLFPFGYGLSYTTFNYRDLDIEAVDQIRVSLTVENTGTRAGREIVQVYLHDIASRLARPEKELKAFRSAALEPGQSQRIEFVLDAEALSYYDDSAREWVAEPGEFQVLVGSSSRDIRLRGRFEYAPKEKVRQGEETPQLAPA